MNRFITQTFLFSRNSWLSLNIHNLSTSNAHLSATDLNDKDIKDISRMPKKYHNRMLHINEPDQADVNPDYYTAMHQTIHFKRKLFAKYGTKSELNPGILWPSESELDEILEFEQEWEPSLQEHWKKLRTDRDAEVAMIKLKEKLISERMGKMKTYINDYVQLLNKQQDLESAQQNKRQALLDEAREYFGYQIDPNDPRFEQMRLAKEEEEKKLRKKKKKEEQLKKYIKGTE